MTTYRTSRKIGKLKTKIFDLEEGRDMKKLAILTGLSLSEIYRIKEGKRGVHDRFIVGVLTAFPEKKFEDLFYIEETSGV